MNKMKIGLVGLPNVGKSSIFRIFTNKNVLIKNYPFSTINPNRGDFDCYDQRVEWLANAFESKSLVFSKFELVDIAGIIKNASDGVGLGGEFLSQIREVDLICHVVRCFENDEVIHVNAEVDPISDLQTVEVELLSSDLDQLIKKLATYHKLKKSDRGTIEKITLLNRIKVSLESGIKIKDLHLNASELEKIKEFSFLTNKPSLIIANCSNLQDSQLKLLRDSSSDPVFSLQVEQLELELQLENKWPNKGGQVVNYLSSFEKESFFKQILKILGLKTFFTAGKSESRSWIVLSQETAVKCASSIHTDISEGFIKAEVYNLNKLTEILGERKIKEEDLRNLKITSFENSSYLVKDGDVCNFLFNKAKKRK